MIKKLFNLRGIAITLVLLIAIVAAFYIASGNSSQSVSQKQLDALADAVKKAAVQCYAVEGFYPADVSYLEDNYGLTINHNKYFVSYEAFSSSFMPQINVFQFDGRVMQSVDA